MTLQNLQKPFKCLITFNFNEEITVERSVITSHASIRDKPLEGSLSSVVSYVPGRRKMLAVCWSQQQRLKVQFHSVLFMIIGSLESAIKKTFLPHEVALTTKYLSQEPVL